LHYLEKLLRTDYLLELRPGPLGSGWPLFLGLGLFFVAGLVVSLRAAREKRWERSLVWGEAVVCAFGLAAILARFADLPGLSARIFPYGAFLAALGLPLAYRGAAQPLPSTLSRFLRALALDSAVSLLSVAGE